MKMIIKLIVLIMFLAKISNITIDLKPSFT
jgi:hypothetical protein